MLGLQIHQKESGILLREKTIFPRCNLGILTKAAIHHPGGDHVLSCETWRVKKIAMLDISTKGAMLFFIAS